MLLPWSCLFASVTSLDIHLLSNTWQTRLPLEGARRMLPLFLLQESPCTLTGKLWTLRLKLALIHVTLLWKSLNVSEMSLLVSEKLSWKSPLIGIIVDTSFQFYYTKLDCTFKEMLI